MRVEWISGLYLDLFDETNQPFDSKTGFIKQTDVSNIQSAINEAKELLNTGNYKCITIRHHGFNLVDVVK